FCRRTRPAVGRKIPPPIATWTSRAAALARWARDRSTDGAPAREWDARRWALARPPPAAPWQEARTAPRPPSAAAPPRLAARSAFASLAAVPPAGGRVQPPIS